MMPPRPMAPAGSPQGGADPATQMAVRNALAGRGMPSAYGQIANRAALSAIAGPGGPTLPAPQGMSGGASPNAG